MREGVACMKQLLHQYLIPYISQTLEQQQKSSRCHQKVAPPVLTSLALQTMLGRALLGYMHKPFNPITVHAYSCSFFVKGAVIAALSSAALSQKCPYIKELEQRGTLKAAFLQTLKM